MATCKSCGAELNPNAKFCPECGTIIEEVKEETSEKPVEENTAVPAEEAAPAEKSSEKPSETEKSEETAPEVKSKEKAPAEEISEVTEKTEEKSAETNAAEKTEKKSAETEKTEEKAPEADKKPAENAKKTIETIKEKEINKTIEAAAEAAADLPQVKEISIIKPKDISVLKPKKAEIIQKKPTPPPAPIPTANAKKTTEAAAEELPEIPEMPPKRVIPDVELPDEPKIPEQSDGSLPVVSSFMNKRDEDFGKDFYSDSSIKNKPAEQKKDEAPAPEPAPDKKKKSPVGVIIAVIVILAAAGAGYYLYSQGYFGSTSEPAAADTTSAYVETTVSSVTETSPEIVSESTSAETSEVITSDTEVTTLASSDESVSDTPESSETSPESAAEALSDVSLTFTHTESVGGSEILNYLFPENPDGFSLSLLTESSQLIIDFTTSMTITQDMIPINMFISDNNDKINVAASAVTESQVIYDYSAIRDTAEAAGFADGIGSIASISFSGVGFPVDITAITATNCIS